MCSALPHCSLHLLCYVVERSGHITAQHSTSAVSLVLDSFRRVTPVMHCLTSMFSRLSASDYARGCHQNPAKGKSWAGQAGLFVCGRGSVCRVHVCMHACLHVCIVFCFCVDVHGLHTCVCVCVCVFACVCVPMCVHTGSVTRPQPVVQTPSCNTLSLVKSMTVRP